MNILLDTNVILEYFAVRERYAIAKRLFDHFRGEGNALFMSVGSSYTMIFLVDKMLRKQMGLRGDTRVKCPLYQLIMLSITAQSDFRRTDEVWAESEFYFYGQVQSAGGKTDAAIKIDVKGKGLLTIATEKDILEGLEKNLLYHNCGVRAKGRQNIDTGEIDRHSLVLVSLVDYEPKFDENYLNKLIKKASSVFDGVDADDLMNELRGREVYA